MRCTIDFRCWLLHFEIIVLNKPLTVGLCNRAVSVECEINGQKQVIKARKQIVLSAGAIGTPKILMLSGVDPQNHLTEMGIKTIQDLPVGKNYHDHLHVSINAVTKLPTSLYGQDLGLQKIKNGAQWMLTRTGVVTSNILEGGAFMDEEKYLQRS
ncbi:GMC family oxidoreductase N-terminal domain-containing protein [Acinetobacter sp. R933-2]|nr:GMC family oxidoreductase N-terminal domain-containing protein [Acinetobacter sp. R933-2]